MAVRIAEAVMEDVVLPITGAMTKSADLVLVKTDTGVGTGLTTPRPPLMDPEIDPWAG